MVAIPGACRALPPERISAKQGNTFSYFFIGACAKMMINTGPPPGIWPRVSPCHVLVW
jgi:hypothetical protein